MESKLVRDVGFIRGARFHLENGVVMFTFGIDPNNMVGPRPATQMDKISHASIWDAFYSQQKADAPQPVPEPDTVAAEPDIVKRPRGRPKRT